VPVKAPLSPHADLWLATCVFVLRVGAHTGILLYCYGLVDTESQQPWILWIGGEKSPPWSQRPGDSAATNKAKNTHMYTDRKKTHGIFLVSLKFLSISIYTSET